MSIDHVQAVIAQAIGQEQAQAAIIALMDSDLRGTLVYLPTGEQYRREHRDREICRARREGVSIAGLAERYNLSEAQVRRIWRRGCAG